MNEEKIDIKQLVQFCEIELGEHPSNYYNKYLNQIINFLKHDEKFKEIDWEDRFYELEEEFEEREKALIREVEYWKFRLAQSERRPIV